MSETVTIEKLVAGGRGLARTRMGVMLVADVCAGETVDVEITGMKAGTLFARPISIIKPSDSRRLPPCRYYGICGGCDWQHIGYDAQCDYKKDIFIDCLKRIGKLSAIPPIELITCARSNYRLRTQLTIDRKSRLLGFFRRGTNDVVRIGECILLVEQLDMLLRRQDELLRVIKPDTAQIKVIAGNSDTAASEPVIAGWTCGETEIEVAGKSFTAAGGDFFQSNAFLLERLGRWVADCIEGGFCADIYGGLGFFSILCAHRFSSAILVDCDGSLVQRAGGNLRRNGITAVSTLASSAELFFEHHRARFPPLDCVIIDPPRPGLSPRVREGLRDAHPRTIVYVSCNPSTQARDAGFLVRKCGYSFVKAALFDLYPQTHHAETAILLK